MPFFLFPFIRHSLALARHNGGNNKRMGEKGKRKQWVLDKKVARCGNSFFFCGASFFSVLCTVSHSLFFSSFSDSLVPLFPSLPVCKVVLQKSFFIGAMERAISFSPEGELRERESAKKNVRGFKDRNRHYFFFAARRTLCIGGGHPLGYSSLSALARSLHSSYLAFAFAS